MSAQFWPCPGCSRHVKRGDAVCPFCGATASVESVPTRTIAGRLSRAALFAAGAVGAAVATTACSSTSLSQPTLQPMYGGTPPPADGSLSGQPAYGGSPVTIETEDSSANDGPGVLVIDAGDASTTPESSSTSDAPSTTDGPADAEDASATPEPTDSSSAADVPMAVPFYGAATLPDE
jgi:hypothetical protein